MGAATKGKTVADIFAFGVLIGMLGIGVALIRPSTFGMSRVKAIFSMIGLTLVSFTLFGISTSDQERPAGNRSNSPQPAPVASQQSPPPVVSSAPLPPVPTPPPAPAAAVAPPARPAPPAAAPRGPDTVRNSGGEVVFVWRDSAKMNEGFRLISAGVNRTQPQLLMPLISCIVPNDTKIVITDSGVFSSTVLVVDGRDTGCRGVVDTGMIARQR